MQCIDWRIDVDTGRRTASGGLSLYMVLCRLSARDTRLAYVRRPARASEFTGNSI